MTQPRSHRRASGRGGVAVPSLLLAVAASAVAIVAIAAAAPASAFQFNSGRGAASAKITRSPINERIAAAAPAAAGKSVAARSPLFASTASSLDGGTSSSSAAASSTGGRGLRRGGKRASVVKIMMTAYIASMCLALPLTLLPLKLLYRLNLITRIKKENLSLTMGQWCSRLLLRAFPFASIKLYPHLEENPEPAVWVCNHISMLDIFFMLGADLKLRGRTKRPIKVVYWKGLESNPVTKLLFTMCGFISVDMEDNGNGNANNYDRSTFKKLLKDVKQAFDEGFDIGILPEGQPNPTPEKGLQPIYTGAFTLARMSRRPVRMMALYGLHKLWHPSDEVGMDVSGRDVAMRVYPPTRNGGRFESAEEFSETFTTVVGHFGATGRDLPKEQLDEWMSGEAWDEIKRRREEEQADAAAAEEMKAEELTAEARKESAAVCGEATVDEGTLAEPVNGAAPVNGEAGTAPEPDVLASGAAEANDDDDYALVSERAGKRRAQEAERLFAEAFSRPMAAPVFGSKDLLSTLKGEELADAEGAGKRRAQECKRRFEEVMMSTAAVNGTANGAMNGANGASGESATAASGDAAATAAETELTAALDETPAPKPSGGGLSRVEV